MTVITLVRHGQANSSSKDEIGYDKLSATGHAQSRWLGEHFRNSDQSYDRVYTGTLRRHIETKAGIECSNYGPLSREPRLNELAYFPLANQFETLTGISTPDTREGFLTHMPLVFEAWRDGRIDSDGETYTSFETRVSQVLAEIQASRQNCLVITSGGVIGMMLKHVLGLDIEGYARLVLAIMNSSTHRLVSMSGNLALSQFNNIAHLEHSERKHAQTYI